MKKKLPESTGAKRMLIEEHHEALSVRRQCELVGLNRSSYYYQPHIHSGNSDLGIVYGQDGQLLHLPSNASVPLTHLPTPSTPFIGREAELALLAERLADPACRLLTIVGPGGSGKTRLAIQAAGRATSHFPQGICFVDLVPVATVDQLPNAILTALGTQCNGITDSLRELLDYLQPRRLLLVLDNFEHLLAGSDLLVELLQAAPLLKILVTSRTRLHLREEWLIPLDGLTLPPSTDDPLLSAQKSTAEIADLEHYAASCLFLHCVRRLQPAFKPTLVETATIFQICHLLAGMPLGIELAAAWVRTLPLVAIARELTHNLTLLQTSFSDMPERHRSMHAVFDHSWELLTAHECHILRQFAVFRGGATRAACETVTGATLADLAELVDHSWLRLRADERYEMHELVRQYCEVKLTSAQQTNGETRDLVRSRHGAYYTDYLAGALERMNYQQEAMPEVMAELGNVLAGLQWAAQTGNVEAAQRMIIGLFFIAEMRGCYHFVLQAYSAAATLIEQTPAGEVCAHNRTLILCWLRWCQASLYRTLGQLERAAAEAEHILVLLADVAESRHQQWLCLMTHWIQAQLTHLRGDLLSARQQAQAMLIRFQEHTFPALFYEPAREAQFFQAHAYALLGQIAWQLGDHDEAQQQMTQALALRDAIGEQRYKALNLVTLATIYQTVGEQQHAYRCVQQALQISQAGGDAITHAHALVALARLEREQGAYVLAQTHGEASLALGRQSGNHRLLMETLVELGNIALALGQTAEAQDRLDEALTTFSRLGTAHSNYVAGVLLGLGRTALAKQEYSRAATYFQQTVAAKGVAAIERQEAIEGLSTIAKSEAEWAPLLY